MDEDWRDQALCAGGDDAHKDLWYSEDPHTIEIVAAVCGRCPVRAQCLTFALTHDEDKWGVWGGLTPEGRADLKARVA